MKILLCTPVFNGGKTLLTLYKSVLNSLANAPVSVLWVIANANSIDNTPQLVEQFISDNPLDKLNIVHIQEADNGMYDAIRKVFDSYSTQCEWMGWINSDDYLTSNCFHDLKVIGQLSDISFVAASRTVLLETGELIACSQEISTISVSLGLHDGFFGNSVQQEGIFFRTKLWNDFKYKDSFAACKLAGDWFLWMHLAKSVQLYENIRSMAVFCKNDGQLSENIESYQAEIDSLLSRSTRQEHRKNLKSLKSQKFIVKGGGVYFVEHPISLRNL